MTRAQKLIIGLCLLVGIGVLARPFVGGVGGLIPGIVAPSAVTQVTYVYEKDQTAVPSGVRAALAKLKKERKINAGEFDRNTVDGGDAVPDQYKIPLAEAEKHGLPILVVQSGDKVLESVLKPTTEQQVLEAAR